jgi:hypothetical protein
MSDTEKIDGAADSNTDSPLKSRKFLLTLLSIGLIVGFSLLATWVTGAANILMTFISGILGALSLYLTGNIISSHITGSQTITSMANQAAAANQIQVTANKLTIDTKAKIEEIENKPISGVGFTSK